MNIHLAFEPDSEAKKVFRIRVKRERVRQSAAERVDPTGDFSAVATLPLCQGKEHGASGKPEEAENAPFRTCPLVHGPRPFVPRVEVLLEAFNHSGANRNKVDATGSRQISAPAAEECSMALSLFDSQGTALDRQSFTWREMIQRPISKLNDDAFTRIRVILMNGLESEAIRFGHSCARMNRNLQVALGRVRRLEQHQRTLVSNLLGADHSPLETTIAYEQAAIEMTASVAQREPDPALAQIYRFGMLEDLDHLYRYSALLDRVEAKDSNNILQSYTDIVPGRPTLSAHRAPEDDVRNPYDRAQADALTKIHALTILSGKYQIHDYYSHIGPLFADPVARQVYAEISSVEEQHLTQYESIIDARETWIEKWLLHEASEAYGYYGCVRYETNPRLRAIWERMLDYELGHLRFAMEVFERVEGRDPAEVLPITLPEPGAISGQRVFIRDALRQEVDLRANGSRIVPLQEEGRSSQMYRERLNSQGSPSETVAAGYLWRPGTELRSSAHRT